MKTVILWKRVFIFLGCLLLRAFVFFGIFAVERVDGIVIGRNDGKTAVILSHMNERTMKKNNIANTEMFLIDESRHPKAEKAALGERVSIYFFTHPLYDVDGIRTLDKIIFLRYKGPWQDYSIFTDADAHYFIGAYPGAAINFPGRPETSQKELLREMTESFLTTGETGYVCLPGENSHTIYAAMTNYTGTQKAMFALTETKEGKTVTHRAKQLNYTEIQKILE